MDFLADLPPVDTNLTSKEKDIVDRLFGAAPAPEKREIPECSYSLKGLAVAIFCLSLAFAMLANPWSGGVLENLPRCGSNSAQLFVKTLIFSGLAFVILKWTR